MKKLISIILVMMLVLSCTVAAFAVQNVTNDEVMENGTITIAGATETYDYALYKLLHLDTYDNTNGAYTYKVEDKWAGFFGTAEALTYVSIDGSGYVSWVDGADVVQFAKAALAYAEANDIAPEADTNSDNFAFITTGGGVFSGLSLGYYLVDTSMGALCGLSTAKPDGHISAKNGVPTVDKSVQEDSHVGTGTAEYGSSNTADIGQEVNFDITIYAQAGAQNYVYHDMMDAGLSMKSGSVEVIHHYGNVTDALEAGVDYILVENPADCELEDWTCSFEVQFTQTFLDTVKSNDKIYIRYTAILNDDAVIGGEGNKNSAELTYGDKHQTTVDSTTTYTYGFDIFKTDADMKPLQGAEFKLLDADKQEITLAYNTATGVYRRATRLVDATEEWCDNTIVVSDASGVARVVGLDNGTYYLRETKAPDGFKILTTDKEFIISGNNLYVDRDDQGDVSVGSSVHVENNKGVTLPETGGIGTLLFAVLGGGTALSTGVVLVTKKRMSKIED